ncbi:MAG: inositol-phosphate phosphatase [Candidatus Kerfeldbacteria bacterium]|nr:inositol-phosphate phosphatase [Candidatus Kerfeldbacteria bacterium]
MNTGGKMSQELRVALDAAETSGRRIMDFYRRNFSIQVKDDHTPVTEVDRAAERIIRDVITAAFPTHGFIGEEFGTTNPASDAQWVIDPIDGTRNFTRGVPLFGSLIALFREGIPVIGVSNAPAMGELLYAERGAGAFRKDGSRIAVSSTKSVRDAFLTFGEPDRFLDACGSVAFEHLVHEAAHTRVIGDAYAYHLVAEGRFDAVLEAGVHVWDIASAAVIVQEAGGRATDLHGNAVTVNTTSILASNGALHDQLLERLRRTSHGTHP